MAQRENLDGSWTFLSNHGHVLVHLSRNPESKIREIADAVGITERRAQSILAELEEAGYVLITREGRRNKYAVNSKKKFRHPAEANRPISDLLAIFS